MQGIVLERIVDRESECSKAMERDDRGAVARALTRSLPTTGETQLQWLQPRYPRFRAVPVDRR